MRRDELDELHYITSSRNVPSMLKHGLLCHEQAGTLSHESVADRGVQERRAGIEIADRPLHQYVNLYFWARNAMLYRCHIGEGHAGLCVLSIDTAVLEISGVVVTDRNAAATGARPEYAGNDGLAIIDKALTFATRWTHPDYLEQERRRQAGQAEVLVPERVEADHVLGAYLPSRAACRDLHSLAPSLPMCSWPRLFFGVGARGKLYEPDEQ